MLDAWDLKERSLKERYVRTVESLNQHTRPLAPLQVGDKVFIQNQTGNNPKRWDRSGIVMEKKDYDQYVIRVSSSGRLTLRNRQFLRRYTPHNLHSKPPMILSHAAQTQLPPRTEPSLNTPKVSSQTIQNSSSRDSLSPALDDTDHHYTSVKTVRDSFDPTQREPPTLRDQPSLDVPTPQGVQPTASPVVRRSTRERKPTKFYEPETGRYVEKDQS